MSTKTPGGQAASEKFLKQQAQSPSSTPRSLSPSITTSLLTSSTEQGAGASNAPGHTEQGVPADAKVAADSYTSTVGIDNKATNVPGEKGDVGQQVGEKPDGVGGSNMKQ